MNAEKLAKLLVDTLECHKALQITELDVTELTDITDRMIICSATSKRHANSMADKLTAKSKETGVKPLGVEGKDESDWILIDLQDVIVHIMLPEIRDFYNLEKLWGMARKSVSNAQNSSKNAPYTHEHKHHTGL